METAGKKEIRELLMLRQKLINENKDYNKKANRDGYLKRQYNMTSKEYDKKLADQGNRCDICRRSQFDFKVRFSVDHNHTTDRVRGLLCSDCNINKVGDHTIASAMKVVEYLKRHGG